MTPLFVCPCLCLSVAQRVSVLVDFSAISLPGVYIRAIADDTMFDVGNIPSDIDYLTLAPIFLCDASSKNDECQHVSPPGMVDTLPVIDHPLAYRTATYQLSYTTPPTTPSSQHVINDSNIMYARPLYPGYQYSSSGACYNVYSPDIMTPSYILPLSIEFKQDEYGINRGYFNNITYDAMSQYTHLYQAPFGVPSPLLFDTLQPQMFGYENAMMNEDTLYTTTNNITGMSSFNGASDAFTYDNEDTQSWNVITQNLQTQFVLHGNETIEIILINLDVNSHPIHIHGYAFWIVSTSEDASNQEKNDRYLVRDIITVPALGWAKIRIQTDNPGMIQSLHSFTSFIHMHTCHTHTHIYIYLLLLYS
jgi:hypothetical protein